MPPARTAAAIGQVAGRDASFVLQADGGAPGGSFSLDYDLA